MAARKLPWEQPAPKAPKRKRSKSTKTLTAGQKRTARERARRAGRSYPNLVDNMAVAAKKSGHGKNAAKKSGHGKKRAAERTVPTERKGATKKRATKKRATKKRATKKRAAKKRATKKR